MKQVKINGSSIQLVQGDITKEETDVIVNAANSHLAHGGGVAKAIAQAAGEKLVEESREAPEIPTGEIYMTTAGNLQSKKVIHAVGPVYKGGKQGEERLLRNCIKHSLRKLEEERYTSISFPAISTGIYGYPLKKAARAMIDETVQYLRTTQASLIVRFVLFSSTDFDEFKLILEDINKRRY